MTHILKPKHRPNGHCNYIFVDINHNTCDTAHDITDTFTPRPIGNGVTLWGISTEFKPISYYLNHPKITVYSKDSHPEMFL